MGVITYKKAGLPEPTPPNRRYVYHSVQIDEFLQRGMEFSLEDFGTHLRNLANRHLPDSTEHVTIKVEPKYYELEIRLVGYRLETDEEMEAREKVNAEKRKKAREAELKKKQTRLAKVRKEMEKLEKEMVRLEKEKKL